MMGSKPRISTLAATSMRRLIRKSLANSSRRRRLHKPQGCRRSAAVIGGGSSVSDKLEALKNLIPSGNDEIKSDRLFQETADYIVLLKTQVFVLQKLIDFYGSQPQENPSDVYGN